MTRLERHIAACGWCVGTGFGQVRCQKGARLVGVAARAAAPVTAGTVLGTPGTHLTWSSVAEWLAGWVELQARRARAPRFAAYAKVPGNIKKPESTDKWVAENAADVWLKRALVPHTADIVCIAWAVDNERPEVETVDPLRRLEDLISERRPRRYVAHNGSRFDFPFLQIAALGSGCPRIAAALHQSKPWDEKCIDTLLWWPGYAARTGWPANLDACCDLLGIERPDNPIPGSEVWRSDFETVAAHCLADIRALREVYLSLCHIRGARPW